MPEKGESNGMGPKWVCQGVSEYDRSICWNVATRKSKILNAVDIVLVYKPRKGMIRFQVPFLRGCTSYGTLRTHQLYS